MKKITNIVSIEIQLLKHDIFYLNNKNIVNSIFFRILNFDLENRN